MEDALAHELEKGVIGQDGEADVFPEDDDNDESYEPGQEARANVADGLADE